jgi:hypothetical protein
MPFLTFGQGPSYYTYGPGVNASNLTSKDIAIANARLTPRRQQRMQGGSVKAMQGGVRRPAPKPARGINTLRYLSWTEKDLSKAVVARRLKSEKAVAEMYVALLRCQ